MQWVHILSALLAIALIIQADAFKSKKYGKKFHKYGKKYHKKGGYHGGDYLSSYHGHHHHHHPIQWLYIPDEHHHHHNSYHTYDHHTSYDHGPMKYHKHKDHKDKFSKFSDDYKLEKYLHKKEKKFEKMVKKFVKKLPLILEILTKDLDKVPESVHLRIPIPAIALEPSHHGKVLEHPISYEAVPEPKYSAKRSPAKRMVQPTSSYTSYVVKNSDQYLHS